MQSRLAVWASLVCAIAAGSAASAQTISRKEAQRRIISAQQDAEDIYNKIPRLRQIDGAVRQDCAAKNQGRTADSAFCGCAAAITMSLWRSGIDPNMAPRLQAFANDPNASADSFKAYQGPELYGPLCHLAEP
jgi:hypothetical protein